MNNLDQMTNAYIEAIYFTETGEEDQPDSSSRLTAYSKARAYIDCPNFCQAVKRYLADVGLSGSLDWTQVGHDLWLTRNGHGTGFWDRDPGTYPEGLGAVMTAMARAMGGVEIEFEFESESESV